MPQQCSQSRVRSSPVDHSHSRLNVEDAFLAICSTVCASSANCAPSHFTGQGWSSRVLDKGQETTAESDKAVFASRVRCRFGGARPRSIPTRHPSLRPAGTTDKTSNIRSCICTHWQRQASSPTKDELADRAAKILWGRSSD